MKANAGSDQWPFGQAPVFSAKDGDKTITVGQTNTILRLVGRQTGTYGDKSFSLGESAMIDMILDGVQDVHNCYKKLIYAQIGPLDSEEKPVEGSEIQKLVRAYCDEHWATESAKGKRIDGGAHFSYLEAILGREQEKSGKSDSFAVGGKLSIADTQLFFLISLHLRPMFAKCVADSAGAIPEFKAAFPKLFAHYTLMSEIAGVKAFLAGGSSVMRRSTGTGLDKHFVLPDVGRGMVLSAPEGKGL